MAKTVLAMAKTKTKIIAIQVVKQNETLGYTSRFTCPRDLLVGVIAIGYADGYPSSAPDGTPVLVNNKRTRVIGKLSNAHGPNEFLHVATAIRLTAAVAHANAGMYDRASMRMPSKATSVAH